MGQIPERLQDAIASRYVLERQVGRGGMATVYLARDLKHERPVAVKVLLPALGALLGAERFLREIKLVASLQHPHILPLYDSGEAHGMLYYVMPYVPGDSLRDRLRRERRLSLRDALSIACDVADALYYAHGNDVIHRDIKPENILLSGSHAIVADFGIARAVHVSGGEQWETLTESGVALGTPTYMSPEQTVGESNIDGRSDIYSLGCVLYEMLAGAPPFTGPDGQLLLAKRFTDPPPTLGAVRDDVPPAVDVALGRALAREPTNRFPNALDFANAMWDERSTAPGATSARARRRVPHRRAWLMSGGMGVAAVLGGLWLARHREAPRPTATQPPPAVAAGRETSRARVRADPGVRPPTTVVTPPPAAVRAPARRSAVPARQEVRAVAPPPDTVLASLRAAAFQTRTRAAEAGARPSDLAEGDSLAGAADAAASAGRRSEAIVALSNATGEWAAAGRAIRARATLDSASGERGAQPAPRRTTDSSSVARRPPPATRPAPVVSAPAPNPADTQAEIRTLIAGYALAIESRSLPAIMQLYPTITPAQQQDWEQFFNAVRDIKVRLTVTRVDVAGASADAQISGTYEYANTSTHRIEQRPVAFRAALRRGATGWRLRAIQ